jgi:hypothetical protein
MTSESLRAVEGAGVVGLLFCRGFLGAFLLGPAVSASWSQQQKVPDEKSIQNLHTRLSKLTS